MKGSKFWRDEWEGDAYLNQKRKSYEAIDSVAGNPDTVLDIGCGYAYESQWMQSKHGCDLYLLDGDSRGNEGKKRDVNFGDVDSFAYYQSIDSLRKSWDERMVYTFIDAADPKIPDVKFDVIYSNLSCGFHYPLSVYNWLLVNHSHDDTVMVFDIRDKHYQEVEKEYNIVRVLYKDSKYSKCLLSLKD